MTLEFKSFITFYLSDTNRLFWRREDTFKEKVVITVVVAEQLPKTFLLTKVAVNTVRASHIVYVSTSKWNLNASYYGK